MAQVQVRLPEEMLQEIDNLVKKGKFKSRSDAIRVIIALHQEREKTRDFYKMLTNRSQESKENPEFLIPFKE